jgi:hypothetical protein
LEAKILPSTWLEVENVLELSATREKPVMASASIGLTPMLPWMDEVPALVIPDLAKIAKDLENPSGTPPISDVEPH